MEKLLYCLVFWGCTLPVFSQNLPNVHEEFFFPFEASPFRIYSRTTNLYYILSNDASHLYLEVYIKDPLVISKVAAAGLTFTINRQDEKTEKNAVAIVYPVFSKTNKPLLFLTKEPGSHVTTTSTDSIMRVNNEHFGRASKNIRVSGIPDVDTLISVYNEDGIKVTSSFDNEMTYTYKLAIKLDLLGLPAGAQKVAYNIRLNEINASNSTLLYTQKGPNGQEQVFMTPAGTPNVPKGGMQAFNAAIDFWGEYTLAK